MHGINIPPNEAHKKWPDTDTESDTRISSRSRIFWCQYCTALVWSSLGGHNEPSWFRWREGSFQLLDEAVLVRRGSAWRSMRYATNNQTLYGNFKGLTKGQGLGTKTAVG